MKAMFTLFLLSLAALFLCACESVKEDARETPIGSVISGKTRNTESYMDKVRKQNRSMDRDVWRPESPDRF